MTKDNNLNDITVIIPVHNVVEGDFEKYFEAAIKSLHESTVKPEEILIVHCSCPGVREWLDAYENFGDLNVTMYENEVGPSFQTQINEGVKQIKTTWFSILEIDDEYSKIWFKNVKEYINSYDDVEVFLPIVVDVNEKGEFLNFTNEALWAMSFTDKLGYLDNNALLQYQNFQSSGMVMKKTSFEDLGGLKDNILLTFIYEFFLRATYNDVQILTVPKLGYKHTNMRMDSLFWTYRFKDNHKIEAENAKFWVDTAKKEYFFKEDRAINFVPQGAQA